jgi:hypothetical protein
LVEPIAKRLKEFAGCDHGQPRLAHWWDVEFPQREKDRRRSIARATTRPRRCAVGWHDSSAGGLGGGAVWSPRSPRNTARAARAPNAPHFAQHRNDSGYRGAFACALTATFNGTNG